MSVLARVATLALAGWLVGGPPAWAMVCSGGETARDLVAAWAGRAMREGASIQVDPGTALSADGFDRFMAGEVDCVILVRELFPREIAAHVARFGHPPWVVPVAAGSFSTKGGTHALAVVVHRDNPLAGLSVPLLRQTLSGIDGQGAAVTRWGQLGATGAWRDRPLHVVTMIARRPTGDPPGIMNHLAQRVLRGAPWRADREEVVDRPGRPALDGIADRVREDPDALGVTGFGNLREGLRDLPVSEGGEPPVRGDAESVADARYPLRRLIYVMIRTDGAARPDPAGSALIRAALSAEGQAMIAVHGHGFLPLTARERAVLGGAGTCGHVYRPMALAGDAPPPMVDDQGRARIIGYNDMRDWLERLGDLFALHHQAYRFALDLPSTRAGGTALAEGRALLAPAGAPMEADALAAFRARTQRVPLSVPVALASLDPAAKSGPLAIIVPASAARRAIDLDALRLLLTTPGAKVAPDVAPSVMHGMAPDTALGEFAAARLLRGGAFRADMIAHRQSRDVVAALAEAGPEAIGFAAGQAVTPGTRALALARALGDAPVPLTEASIRAGLYPLNRPLYLHVDPAVLSGADGLARAYLGLALSCEGQALLDQSTPVYYPLDAHGAAAAMALVAP